MRRVETGESYVGEVPLNLFREESFKGKGYLDRASEVICEGIEELKVARAEPIHICSGYILSKARQVLDSNGYAVVNKKIAGATQELAEAEFIKSLVKLGVGDRTTVSSMRSFDAFLRWVLDDIGARERFVKTGWSSWPRLKKEEGRH
ncbi:MAG: hypothetical protein JSV27_00335 [Candidatus Bathyarchaeota archaeon]|nr:MAG: hypothetical protein JSV27_00335 [Candidatus Bathyarchaeota archaeon]